ncbi:MAG TPA: YibE/F family protein [Acidimicrobiales bacterium]|nr:YibE/F family protein [Acidimicrobiales bacterium]
MAHPHVHDARDFEVPDSTRTVLLSITVPLLLAIAAGLVLLWPSSIRTDAFVDALAPDDQYVARIVSVTRGPCQGTTPDAGISCETAEVELKEGPDRGQRIPLLEEPTTSGWNFSVGDLVVLAYYPGAGEGYEYSLVDRERRTPLLLLAALFAVAVVALGRWKGARALAGVAVSLAILTAFILPALLDGKDPVLVALVGGGLITVLALYLSHGVNAGSTVALIGAFASLVLVGLLAWGFIELTQLSGRAAEEAGLLQISASQVQLQGLLLAGIVIGTLGVLDDVTVLQVSAVWELHHANPEMSRRDVYRAAVRIGRDHIASTVNTLVLAYAGASLPLFLLLTQARQSLSDTANAEIVATEIVRTLVGSIGLVASVPLTTLLAAWVVGEHQRGGRSRNRNDPRRYRSRTERQLWDGASTPAEPPDRAL